MEPVGRGLKDTLAEVVYGKYDYSDGSSDAQATTDQKAQEVVLSYLQSEHSEKRDRDEVTKPYQFKNKRLKASYVSLFCDESLGEIGIREFRRTIEHLQEKIEISFEDAYELFDELAETEDTFLSLPEEIRELISSDDQLLELVIKEVQPNIYRFCSDKKKKDSDFVRLVFAEEPQAMIDFPDKVIRRCFTLEEISTAACNYPYLLSSLPKALFSNIEFILNIFRHSDLVDVANFIIGRGDLDFSYLLSRIYNNEQILFEKIIYNLAEQKKIILEYCLRGKRAQQAVFKTFIRPERQAEVDPLHTTQTNLLRQYALYFLNVGQQSFLTSSELFLQLPVTVLNDHFIRQCLRADPTLIRHVIRQLQGDAGLGSVSSVAFPISDFVYIALSSGSEGFRCIDQLDPRWYGSIVSSVAEHPENIIFVHHKHKTSKQFYLDMVRESSWVWGVVPDKYKHDLEFLKEILFLQPVLIKECIGLDNVTEDLLYEFIVEGLTGIVPYLLGGGLVSRRIKLLLLGLNPYFLRYMPPEEKKDPEFAMFVLINKPDAYSLIDRSLLANSDFMIYFLLQGGDRRVLVHTPLPREITSYSEKNVIAYLDCRLNQLLILKQLQKQNPSDFSIHGGSYVYLGLDEEQRRGIRVIPQVDQFAWQRLISVENSSDSHGQPLNGTLLRFINDFTLDDFRSIHLFDFYSRIPEDLQDKRGEELFKSFKSHLYSLARLLFRRCHNEEPYLGTPPLNDDLKEKDPVKYAAQRKELSYWYQGVKKMLGEVATQITPDMKVELLQILGSQNRCGTALVSTLNQLKAQLFQADTSDYRQHLFMIAEEIGVRTFAAVLYDIRRENPARVQQPERTIRIDDTHVQLLGARQLGNYLHGINKIRDFIPPYGINPMDLKIRFLSKLTTLRFFEEMARRISTNEELDSGARSYLLTHFYSQYRIDPTELASNIEDERSYL